MASERRQITWSKEQRALAASSGKGLVACGCDTKSGYMAITGPMDHKAAVKLVCFAIHMDTGKTPDQAFAIVYGRAT